MSEPGILYIVATPIGNLDDITLRAIKTLFSVDAIACEDTRRTGLLLNHLRSMYHILVYDTSEKRDDSKTKKAKLISYFEQNENSRIPEIINALKNGLNIALVSDAGTPAISDPGFRLIRECLREKLEVVSIPGASSVLVALTSSGLPTDKFLFLGYPPRKPGHRLKFLENAKKSIGYTKSTIILFEAPHKLVKTLTEIERVFGDIEIVLARELTKLHEETKRGKISAHLAGFVKKEPKGEFVILL